ncbi:MAG TPA: hypothetical protein PLQ00_13895 [Thermoguttaceae bacterium]|nr:hypothetical protein [Thermoguttaceae bacterium]
MSRRCAFWIGRDYRPTIGFAWLLGMLILLGWASPLRGQSANQPSSPSPAQQTRNAFWPLDPNGPPPSTAPGKASAPASSTSPSPVSADKPPVDPSAAGSPHAGVGRRQTAKPNRIREGTRISQQKGVFTITGDRVVFAALDGTLPKLVILENLNLQRVIQTIQGSNQEELWVVTGRVTEFQGVNYLLLERAIRIDEADLEQAPSVPSGAIVRPTPPAMPSAVQTPLEPTSAAGESPH